MRTRSVGVLLLALLAFVPACGNDEKEGSSAPTSTKSAPSAAEGGDVEVSLLEPGSTPRRVFRLAARPGAEQRATMRMVMGIKQDIDGQAGPAVTIPPIDMGMVVHVDKIEGDELDATFRYDAVNVVDDGKADPAVVQSLRASGIDKLTQLSGTLRMTTRGELLDASLRKPADFPAALEQFLDQIEPQLQNMAVPFPEEAIGPGARWSASTDLTLSGIKMRNEYIYKLVEATADAYRIDVTIKQTARPQTVDLQGVKARITSFLTQGGGTLTGTLTDMLPRSSSSKVAGDQVFEFDEGGKTSTLRQHLTIDVTLR